MFSKKRKRVNIPVGHVLGVIFSRENKGAPIPLSFGFQVPGVDFYTVHLSEESTYQGLNMTSLILEGLTN